MQIANVTHVEKIEIAITEDDAFSGAAPLLDALAELLAIQNFAVLHFSFMRRR
jgi:hypothetical protein